MRGKFTVRVSARRHRCHTPINWFFMRFAVGTEWECWCGQPWRYIDTFYEPEWRPIAYDLQATRMG